MVLLEAMAGKCPVVCVRSSGTDDVVVDAYNGFKTLQDAEQWAGKVEHFYCQTIAAKKTFQSKKG